MLDLTMPANTSMSSQYDEQLREHFARQFADPVEILNLPQHFRREGYVKLNNLVPSTIHQEVNREVYRLLDESARRIDITIAETGNTPRKMSTVSQQAIA